VRSFTLSSSLSKTVAGIQLVTVLGCGYYICKKIESQLLEAKKRPLQENSFSYQDARGYNDMAVIKLEQLVIQRQIQTGITFMTTYMGIGILGNFYAPITTAAERLPLAISSLALPALVLSFSIVNVGLKRYLAPTQ